MFFHAGAWHRTCLFWASLPLILGAWAPAGAQGHAGHQVATPAPDEAALIERWRRAHEAVGQFPRGHADLLRWEQTHLPKAGATPAVSGTLGRARAVELALRDAPTLLEGQGLNQLERAQLRRKVWQQSLEVERAWVDAVIASQVLEQAKQAVETAEIGAELARRMLAVGHWSRARQMQEELPLWQARTRLSQARWTQAQTAQKLWQHLGGFLGRDELQAQLPLQWAEPLPAVTLNLEQAQTQALQAHPRWSLEEGQAQLRIAALAPAQLQAGRDIIERVVGARGTTEPARIDARTGLTHAQIEALQAQAAADRLKRQIQADVSVALEAFKTSSEQSRQTQSELVRLASAAEQETLWRYNGMLASTWQLLASARHRMEAVEAALQARRQAWHAYLDLQAVLAGLPYNGGLDLASSGASGSPKEGH